jgi:hypothetical protein
MHAWRLRAAASNDACVRAFEWRVCLFAEFVRDFPPPVGNVKGTSRPKPRDGECATPGGSAPSPRGSVQHATPSCRPRIAH